MKIYELVAVQLIFDDVAHVVHAQVVQCIDQKVAAQEIAVDLALSLENLSSDDKILIENEILRCINKDKNSKYDAEMVVLGLEYLRAQSDYFKTIKNVSYICGAAALPVVIFGALILCKYLVENE
jgi:hypothetical protein